LVIVVAATSMRIHTGHHRSAEEMRQGPATVRRTPVVRLGKAATMGERAAVDPTAGWRIGVVARTRRGGGGRNDEAASSNGWCGR
jgi:hypothetical protein